MSSYDSCHFSKMLVAITLVISLCMGDAPLVLAALNQGKPIPYFSLSPPHYKGADLDAIQVFLSFLLFEKELPNDEVDRSMDLFFATEFSRRNSQDRPVWYGVYQATGREYAFFNLGQGGFYALGIDRGGKKIGSPRNVHGMPPQEIPEPIQRVLAKGQGIPWSALQKLQEEHRRKGTLLSAEDANAVAPEKLLEAVLPEMGDEELSDNIGKLSFRFVQDERLSQGRNFQVAWINRDNLDEIFIHLNYWNKSPFVRRDQTALVLYEAAQALWLSRHFDTNKVSPDKLTDQVMEQARAYANNVIAKTIGRSEYGFPSLLDDKIAFVSFLDLRASGRKNQVLAEALELIEQDRINVQGRPPKMPAFLVGSDATGRVILSARGEPSRFRTLQVSSRGFRPYEMMWKWHQVHGWTLAVYAYDLAKNRQDRSQMIAQFRLDKEDGFVPILRQAEAAFETQTILQLDEIVRRTNLLPLMQLFRDVPVDLEAMIHELYPGDYEPGELIRHLRIS